MFCTSLCLFCAVLLPLALAQPPTPSIQSVVQTSQDTFRLDWSVLDPDNRTQLLRYRVRVTRREEDGSNSTLEWPDTSQLSRVRYDSTEAAYAQLETSSSFECFNECVRDAECRFVVRSLNQSGINCFLKNSVVSVQNTTLDADSEYALVLADYVNTTTVRLLGSNAVYLFQVSVYDLVSAAWSDFSAEFKYDANIYLQMNFTRTGLDTGKITWSNPKYFVARYSLLFSVNQSTPSIIQDLNFQSIRTAPVASNYFYISDYGDYSIQESADACEGMCLDFNLCVQFVYFSADFHTANGSVLAKNRSCYTVLYVDIAQSVYKTTGIVIKEVRNPSLEFAFDEPLLGNWSLELGTLSTYSLTFSKSASQTYQMTDLTPSITGASVSSSMEIKWNSPEMLEYSRYALAYHLNGSDELHYYIEPSELDYFDPDQTLFNATDLDECFENCFNQTTCLAFSFEADSGVCKLKKALVEPVVCSSEATCATVPAFASSVKLSPLMNSKYCFSVRLLASFGYVTPASKPFCIASVATVQTEQIDVFFPGKSARVRCLPYQSNGQINWYRDLEPLDLAALSAEISDNNETLTFHNVSGRVHNGLYSCENVLNNSQVIYSRNVLSVKVNETAPMRPESPTIRPFGSESGVVITWTVEPYIAPVTCAIVFWSLGGNSFDNGTECAETLRSGVLFLNTTFDCKTEFKIQLENAVGWSEASEIFQLEADYCRGGGNKKPKSYLAGFIVVLCLLVVAVAAGGFFGYKKYRSRYRSEYIITD